MKPQYEILLFFTLLFLIIACGLSMISLAEAQPLFNEIMTSNTTTVQDEEGYNPDWIELYNPGDTSLELTGYGLSDRPDNPYKWMFPSVILESKQYLLVFASGNDIKDGDILHTNFKIDVDGETLVLTDPNGVLCDSVYVEIEGTDISYGRSPDGGTQWTFFFEPTPGESNTTEGYQEFTDASVEMWPPAGFYDSTILFDLSTDSINGEIRYSLDGSEPTVNSPLYSSAISIDSTTVVRARVFEEHVFPGPITTQTYFIDEQCTLPVISLSTNPDNLWSSEIGIFYEDFDQKIFNWARDWERPIHMEFYESGGSPGFSIDAGVKLSGYVIRGNGQKALAIFARPKYGYNKIDYQIFPDLPITEFKSVILRNGGNEPHPTNFIDALCHDLVKNTTIDVQAFRPAIVFINGVYWGIYNIREKQNEDYLAAHYSIDPNNVDMLEYIGAPHVIEGDSIHYTAMINYVETHDMNDPANYEYIKTQIDIENFIEYNVAEIYLANQNWIHHNVKLWRPKTTTGRWKWIFCDLDQSMQLNDTNRIPNFTQSNERWYAPFSSKLIENDDFKYTFINLFSDAMNTYFKPAFIIQRINEIKALLEPDMPDHIVRWKDDTVFPDKRIMSMEDWNSNIAIIEEFAEQRPDSMYSYIMAEFGLSGTANVNLNVSSTEAGNIKINSIIPDDYPWNGIYFKDIPIQLTALPTLGYEFVGWTGAELADSLSVTITLTDSISVTAVFEKTGSNTFVLHQSQSPYRITGIQSVPNGSSLTIEAGVELLMSPSSSITVSGEIHMNGTTDNPIRISQEGGQNWNGIFLDNATGNSSISNVIISGASSWGSPEDFPAVFSSLESDVTIDNVRFENNQQSIFAKGGTVTVRNCFFADTNRNESINIKNAVAVVENCRFEDVFVGDAVDYDGIHDGIIRNNCIFGTVDSDGDGIDIGDGCANVLITGNLIYDCEDKGISIGEGSTDIRVEKNIIAGCHYAIAVKDSTTAFIDHNTLFDNDYAVAAYEKGAGWFGGGTAVVSNSILAHSNISPLFCDELSEITVSYTLCDSELLPGEGNIMDDPLLASPDNRIFDLLPGSPAIGSDSSGSEMGALAYKETVLSIVINEINYNSSDDFNPGDWVELYNRSDSPVDISGWIFKDEDDEHSFVLPVNTVIPPNSYVVLCSDETLFYSVFPDVNNCIGSFGFGLNAGGELIRLYDANDGLVDWVKYNDSDPWPSEPDGEGSTLALMHPKEDNTRAEQWATSADHGTPGGVNVFITGINEDAESDIPLAFSLGQNYPNPFNPVTTIPFSVPESCRVTIEMYSILGQRVATIIDDNLLPGNHHVVFNADHLSSGIYFYCIEAKGFIQTKSMLLLK